MKAKEFLNSHQLVVISDFIKRIEDVPADKWLHDFMQEELAFLIKQGITLANHDDYVSLDMVRSSTWLIAIHRAYSGTYPDTLVDKPPRIVQKWSIKIENDTSDVQAALSALEEQIQSSPRLKVISGDVIGVIRANSGKPPVTLIVKPSDIIQEFSDRHDTEKYEASLCSTYSSGSIEQQTLSTVLGNTLHTVSSNMASSTAVELAQAVKAAFDVLENKNATAR